MTAETPPNTPAQQPAKPRQGVWGWVRNGVTAYQVWRLLDGREKAAWVIDTLSGLL